MRKILALFLSFWATICIQVTQQEIDAVNDSVMDATSWLEQAWAGKVNKSEERIIKKEVDLSIENNEAVPAGRDAIIQKHLNRPGYKKRKDREEAKELGGQ